MYASIIVPVDLAHTDQLQKALGTATDLAEHFKARLTFLGATTPEPNDMAHNPDEFGRKLKSFASSQVGGRGVETDTKVAITHDPTRDLAEVLLNAVEESGADLVVMGSHQPGMAEHVFASHAGYVASHAHRSVMIVR